MFLFKMAEWSLRHFERRVVTCRRTYFASWMIIMRDSYNTADKTVTLRLSQAPLAPQKSQLIRIGWRNAMGYMDNVGRTCWSLVTTQGHFPYRNLVHRIRKRSFSIKRVFISKIVNTWSSLLNRQNILRCYVYQPFIINIAFKNEIQNF